MSLNLYPHRWPPTDPSLIQLYSMATPNGQKVSICLEEMGLRYDAHLINISQGDQMHPEFIRISPNNKIPALIDPDGPEGKPLALMESIVILHYLANKTGQFFPRTYRAQLDAQQWLTFQAAHIGPMFGQFGHFHVYAKDKTSDTYGEQRYTAETRRLLGILEARLKDREYLMDDYSIVDMATAPWVNCLAGFYQSYEYLGMAEFTAVERWRAQVTARPAYQRGMVVCKP
ncbi:MAG: glutathione S-transferase N-terminal domain-containing protein [Pseudomonadales bacterium]|jgi:GST-like protein|nr:glutathione S-transferase N-terminal domain-containing protein [Pseudomonadales bacterium]